MSEPSKSLLIGGAVVFFLALPFFFSRHKHIVYYLIALAFALYGIIVLSLAWLLSLFTV